MGAGHAHRLYRHGHSPVHALPPHTKLAAAFAFVVVVVSTPREAMWAFALYAALLGCVAYAARVPAGFLLGRLLPRASGRDAVAAFLVTIVVMTLVIRSYALAEEDGTVGTVCIYQATEVEAIRRHAQIADLPVDEIVPVADTVIVRPDPEPAVV